MMQAGDLETVLMALRMPTFFVDHDHRIIVVNAEAKVLFGPELIGRHYMAVLRQPPIVEAIEAVEGGGSEARATFVTTRSGVETLWQANASPLVLSEGRGVLVSLEDTTAEREADQMRRDFVANVSHELRTPLTALIGFIETLRNAARDDPAARDRFLGTMAREAARMNRLVEDLLSLSRVESQQRVRPRDQVSIKNTILAVARSLPPTFFELDVELLYIGLDEMPEILGDSDQLRQVFTNLIENAVKYGGDGRAVTVCATLVDRDPVLRVPAMQIDVVDQGDGIDPIHIPRLSERFYRIDTHRSRERGGTGLGLAIVKHIVNRHRGRFRISSELGVGSRFSVILPLT